MSVPDPVVTMDVMFDDEPMSGAQLKMTLQGLGLPPSWFAARLGVTMRTVVRWFDSKKIPERARTELQKVYDQTLEEMRTMAASVGDNETVLYTFRTDAESTGEWPASWHRSLTFRVAEHLKANGHAVRVEYRWIPMELP